MKKLSALIVSLGLLGGCATIMEGQTQPLTIVTPGAEGAQCYLYNEDIRYKVRAGETNEIMKSNHDLTVECLAPGNRRRSVIVNVQLEPGALANVSNGIVPGTAYDHFSRGMYAYPEQVVVDFRNVRASPYPLPDYMNADMQGSKLGEVEYYGTKILAYPGEEDEIQPAIQKRDFGADSITGNPFASGDEDSEAPASATEK